jgi:hypothetical protein
MPGRLYIYTYSTVAHFFVFFPFWGNTYHIILFLVKPCIKYKKKLKIINDRVAGKQYVFDL